MSYDAKETYERIWASGQYGRSASVPAVVDFVLKNRPERAVLDVGCGDGSVVRRLRAEGVRAYGIDATLAGIDAETRAKCSGAFFEVDAMRIPFGDRQFEMVISSDFLEHLPAEHVAPVIYGMTRVCKRVMAHWICTRPDVMGAKFGQTLHLTVQPIEWWAEQFEPARAAGLDVKLSRA